MRPWIYAKRVVLEPTARTRGHKRDISETDVREKMIRSTHKTLASAVTLLAAGLLVACSGIPRKDAEKADLARYTAYAGEPVSDFRMYTRYDGWTPIDNHHLVIHTNVNESYLLTVAEPCIDLPFATTLAIKSRFPHTVSSGFDSIRVGRDTCRITEIRPLDYKRMKADLAREKAHG